MTVKYDEKSIQTLDPLTHIRKRSGMYIGRLGDGSHPENCIYIFLKEVFDNAVDEWIMGHGSKIEVNVDYALGQVSIRDYGRGIPLGKVVDCVSQINTGAKYNTDVFQFSVGLNGVGTKAVNALSSHFEVVSRREGKLLKATFSKGILISKIEEKDPQNLCGTEVTFVPDFEIFKKYKFQPEYVEKRLWWYAYLNKNLEIFYNGQLIKSENGLLDLLEKEVSDEKLYEPISFASKTLEFSFMHTHAYGETSFSFVNGQYTSDGGTHLQAFREGLVKAINEFSKKNFQSIDVREGLIAAVLVKVQEPVFESQTKNKLSNTDIKSTVSTETKDAVLELLFKNNELSKLIIDRITFNEKLRKELSAVKKEAREKQKKKGLKIPKLRDCKYHYNQPGPMGEQTMLFLTEGESASASLVSSRNPFTQAVYSLRGKPMNVLGMKLDQLYKNEEMYHIMSALNIEEDISGLRYSKIILATDADVDGLHIRNLLITFFLTYFESLVVNGHLYILETPLFKVRDKHKTLYCYSEEEKEKAVQQLNKTSLEITRFKGLGEISPDEFKAFIGADIRLQPVTIHCLSDVKPTLEFYMGKNTFERKRFIMDNLCTEI